MAAGKAIAILPGHGMVAGMRCFGSAGILAMVIGLAGCQSVAPVAPDPVVAGTTAKLHALPGAVATPEARAEAARLARVAEEQARALARAYDVRSPAWLHNCLVNTGLKNRGLCWHYMEDLFVRMAAENPRFHDLHTGVRDDGSTLFEHNCVVVTAAGQPFATGLVLDPWHRPGQLTVLKARGEGKPWHEQPGYTRALEIRASARPYRYPPAR